MNFHSHLDDAIEEIAKNPAVNQSVGLLLKHIRTELDAAIFNGGNSFDPGVVRAFSDALAAKVPDLVHAVIANTELPLQAAVRAARVVEREPDWKVQMDSPGQAIPVERSIPRDPPPATPTPPAPASGEHSIAPPPPNERLP